MNADERGLAAERTTLAWTRTALSFGAVGGIMVRSHAVIGLIVLGTVPVIWQLGRVAAGQAGAVRRARLITATIVAVAITALIIASLGKPTPLRLPRE